MNQRYIIVRENNMIRIEMREGFDFTNYSFLQVNDHNEIKMDEYVLTSELTKYQSEMESK